MSCCTLSKRKTYRFSVRCGTLGHQRQAKGLQQVQIGMKTNSTYANLKLPSTQFWNDKYQLRTNQGNTNTLVYGTNVRPKTNTYLFHWPLNHKQPLAHNVTPQVWGYVTKFKIVILHQSVTRLFFCSRLDLIS